MGPIATYHSPGGRRGTQGCVFQERKMHGVATNIYLRKTLEKPKGVYKILRIKGSGFVYMREGISTVRLMGQQPLIKYAKS